MSRRLPLVALPVAALLALAACGTQQQGGSPDTALPTTSSATTSTPSTTPPVTTTTRAATPTTTRPSSTSAPAPTRAAAPTPTSPPVSVMSRTVPRPQRTPTPTPTTPTCSVPSGVTAAQVLLVVSSGSSATVTACHRSGSRYLRDLGPYAGHVGRNGVSSAKREGDLKTPAGTFVLRGGFGTGANPGLPQGWFTVDANDVWVDDSGSSLYNTHQRKPVNGRWTSAEDLLNTPAYTYAQVIGYNESRTPGRGSAIFLHVDTGGGTAGCVSLPTSALLAVMRWEQSGAVISIR